MVISCALVTLSAALLLRPGLALECHTCNSDEDAGCGRERFHPSFPTDDYAECDVSARRTLLELYSIVLPHHQLSDTPTTVPKRPTCLKFTVKSKNTTFPVTFRGCSEGSKQSCSGLRQLLPVAAADIRLEDCYECSDKDLCNAAPAVMSLSSALLLIIDLFSQSVSMSF